MTAAAFDIDEIGPWTDPGHPDPVLDAAYCSGIVPPDRRWESNFTYRPNPPTDSLTILKAMPGRVLAKRIHADGRIVDYDQAKHFDMVRAHVRPGLDDLEVILGWLAGQPNRCAVRGDIASGAQVERHAIRRLHGRDDGPATLIEAPRQWLAVDSDDFPDEATLTRAERRISELAGSPHHLPRKSEPGDLISAARIATSCLPVEFYSAECLVWATATHGLKPGLRIRLWFWLDRAVSTGEAKYWFRNAPIDPSVFGAAQPIYTAAPIFADGAVDPVPERMARIAGKPSVSVPPAADLRPKPKPAPARRSTVREGLSPAGEVALDKAEDAILGAARGSQEPTLVKQSYRIGRVVAAGDLPERLAHTALLDIGRRLPDLDGSWPWQAAEVRDKIDRAFDAGLHGGRHA